MHVAMPKKRDGRSRPPVIPPSVLAAKQSGQTVTSGSGRKLQKDIQAREHLLPLPSGRLKGDGVIVRAMPCNMTR